MLFDNHNRPINYLRLAVTDRCNLRCFYCMPESGIDYVKRRDLLTYEEMTRLISVFSSLGITKLRITGGEPFVRKDMMDLLGEISRNRNLTEINITTNGTFTADYVERLADLGISGVNLSLDSLDRERFRIITRRDMFDSVMSTFHALLQSSLSVKVNMVVMEGRNIEDIIPMVELTRENDLSVRFIEEMPFNGTEGKGNATFWPSEKTLEYITRHFGEVIKLDDPPHSTSANYTIDGYRGSFGTIAAYTRTFCGSCNRIRITPQGTLRTCLYGNGVMNFRDMMRQGHSDEQLAEALKNALGQRARDGFEAERQRRPVGESMATIGG